jgi:hypothetical protein
MLVWCVAWKLNSSSFSPRWFHSVTLSSTRRQLRKMATSGVNKLLRVLDFHVNKSVASVQRHFRTKFGTDSPSGKSIRTWYLQFQDTGCICKLKSTGRPMTEEEAVEHVRPSFVRSPRKSTYRASRELGTPQKTVWRVLRNRLQMWPYRPQLLQALKWLTTTCYKEFSRNLITGLICVVLRLEHILNICNLPGKYVVSFPFNQY